MGFFAGELYAVLERHKCADLASPWDILARMGLHPQQIERLQCACEDVATVASLQAPYLTQLRQELQLTPIEWARLQAGIEADVYLRLLLYHKYSLEEAASKANMIFAAAIKDKLATGGRGESVYPMLSESDRRGIHPGPVHHHPRGPRPKDRSDY